MITIPIGIKGYYTIELLDAKSGKIKQHIEFSNILTDSALDLIGSSSTLPNLFNSIDVGVGTDPPLGTDLQLAQSAGTRTNFDGGYANITTTSTTPECARRQITRLFTETQVNDTLTEVGFWTAPTGGVLVNRALFRDASGELTTIDKTPSDYLRVIYEYQVYAPQDVTGSVPCTLFHYPAATYTLRPQGVNVINNWVRLLDDLGDWRASGYSLPVAYITPRTSINTSVNAVGIVSWSLAPYAAGTLYRDVTFDWPIQPAGPIIHGVASISPWGAANDPTKQIFQLLTDPTVIQLDTQKLRLTLRFSWNRK